MAAPATSDFLACVSSVFFWQNFWPNFFADFFATLIVGVGITWLISWLAAKRRKIGVIMLASVQRSPGSLALEFKLANTGKVDFRENELYWHLWMAKRLEPDEHTHTEEVSIGEPYVRFSALLKHPAFSGTLTVLITIPVKNEPVGDRELLYSLSTAYGMFPRNLNISSRGVVLSDKLGIVEIDDVKRSAPQT